MSAVNDGGTAFPMQDPQAISAYASARVAQLPEGSSADERARVYLVARAEAAGGMTVRDHFAGLAMAAIISNTTWFDKITEVQAMRLDLPSEPDALGQAVKHMVAVHAVEFADAMLKAREQKGGAA